ncbi:MAG: RluA family pseudouridine synthase, partial [Planctomycetota bacterium]
MPRPPAAFPARPPTTAAKDKYICRGLRIVHEDDDLIVIEKPAGMLSAIVPGDHGDNVFGKVKEHVKRRGSRAWIIHRLDREASGLLVFAKSERAYELLKEELSARRMHRVYAAVVEREFAPGESEGTIRSYLYEDTRGMIHSVESPGEVPLHLRRDTDNEEHATAKPATTHYRVLTQAKNRSLLHIRLETGRKHQIRVHLNQLGHSIIGDRRYGSDSGTETRLCLHAMTLAFIHPATGKEVRFESPIAP